MLLFVTLGTFISSPAYNYISREMEREADTVAVQLTGDVPGALKNVADTYENELSIALRVMTNMIEPVMIIVMALGVGFLLLSVLSAMFAITANIAR
jgi:Zn-dependent protease with chaperone function